jgi:hypothetical protein
MNVNYFECDYFTDYEEECVGYLKDIVTFCKDHQIKLSLADVVNGNLVLRFEGCSMKQLEELQFQCGVDLEFTEHTELN